MLHLISWYLIKSNNDIWSTIIRQHVLELRGTLSLGFNSGSTTINGNSRGIPISVISISAKNPEMNLSLDGSTCYSSNKCLIKYSTFNISFFITFGIPSNV